MAYHIRKDGTPGVCHAQKGNCPLGGDSEHYSTASEAEQAAQERLEQEYGIIPGQERPEQEYGIIPAGGSNELYNDPSEQISNMLRTGAAVQVDSMGLKPGTQSKYGEELEDEVNENGMVFGFIREEDAKSYYVDVPSLDEPVWIDKSDISHIDVTDEEDSFGLIDNSGRADKLIDADAIERQGRPFKEVSESGNDLFIY